MAANHMKLSKEQVLDFAFEVFTDIADYISTHQEEYEEFLRNEELAEGGEEE